MIQSIGVMVGFYIITRMLQIVPDKSVGTVTRIFGVVTAIVTILCTISLLFTPSSLPR